MQVLRGECQEDTRRLLFPEQFVAKVARKTSFDIGFDHAHLETRRYDAGELILCHRGVEKWIRLAGAAELRLFAIPDYVLRATADELRISSPKLEALPRLKDARIEHLIAALEEDARTNQRAGSLYTESITFALATALLQQRWKPAHTPLAARGSLTPRQMQRVRDFVMSRLDRNIGLVELAGAVDLSPSYFSTLFRRTSSMTPHAFVMEERMKRARCLLKAPRLKIVDVAIECGFRSQQHFARVFRQQAGASPTEYKRQTERFRNWRSSPIRSEDAEPTPPREA